MEKLPIFDQNRGLSPLENQNFSTFFNLLFLYSRKAFFSLEYLETHLPGAFCLKEKNETIANF